MFTEPKFNGARPNVSAGVTRPPVPDRASVGNHTRPSAGGQKAASALPTSSAMYLDAQRELDRVLRSLGAKPEGAEPSKKQVDQPMSRKSEPATPPARPVFRQPVPKQAEARPAPRQPMYKPNPESVQVAPKVETAGHTEASAPAKSNNAPRTEFKIALVLVGIVAVGALAMSVISHQVTDSSLKTTNTQLKANTTKIAELSTKQDVLAKSVSLQIANLHATVAEIKYPSSEFAEGQELFKLRRYADAESAYRAYLARYPSGRMVASAWNNAAVASALQGKCETAKKYAARIEDNSGEIDAKHRAPKTRDIYAMCKALSGSIPQKPN
jgi:TolA-binding protein